MWIFVASFGTAAPTSAAESPATVALEDSVVRLNWTEQSDGWHLSQVAVRTLSGEISAGAPVGRYTVLYSPAAPDNTPTPFFLPGHPEPFPGEFTYATKKWEAATSPVSLNDGWRRARVFSHQRRADRRQRLRFLARDGCRDCIRDMAT